MTSSSGLIISYYGSQNSETLNVYHLITKDIIKDNDEQQDEEVHRMRSRRILSTQSGVRHSPGTWMCLSTWMASRTHSLGIFNGGCIT